MAASGLLRERDLRALTAVIEDGLSDDPGPAMPSAVLGGLHRLVPSEIVIFQEIDIRNQHSVMLQAATDNGGCSFIREWESPYPEYWRDRQEFLPVSYLDRSGDLLSVLRYSDFYAFSDLKNAPVYAEFVRRAMGTYGLIVPLPAPSGRTRRLHFGRADGPDFGERDLLILRLLRPHLHEVYLDAERRRRGVPHLSRREREVLQLVSQGYSNADIARILFIAVSTVRKHMENIFNRTGVRTRAAAAALALTHASLATPPAHRRSGGR